MPFQLSAVTSKTINWSSVEDGIRLVLSELGSDRGRASVSSLDSGRPAFDVDPEVVSRAFEKANTEFRRALEPTTKWMRWGPRCGYCTACRRGLRNA
jgi:hypothetical protein